jgi:hypothetical protein
MARLRTIAVCALVLLSKPPGLPAAAAGAARPHGAGDGGPHVDASSSVCALTGQFFLFSDPTTLITMSAGFPSPYAPGVALAYNATCTGPSCYTWSNAVVFPDAARPTWGRLYIQFDAPGVGPVVAWLLGTPPNCAQNVMYFGGTSQWSVPWCRVGNPSCTAPFDAALWSSAAGASVHLLEVSHSDIG